jgi:ferredoxin
MSVAAATRQKLKTAVVIFGSSCRVIMRCTVTHVRVLSSSDNLIPDSAGVKRQVGQEEAQRTQLQTVSCPFQKQSRKTRWTAMQRSGV